MFTTIYKKKVTKRKGPDKGKTITEELYYRTKTHTDMHERLRKEYGGTTYSGGKFYSHFTTGMPTPMVLGGKKVN